MKLDEVLGELDKVLMHPGRLLIVSLLFLFGPRKESEVVRALGMSWGAFSTHIKMLEREGYVVRKRVFTRRGYRTYVRLTEEGKTRYRRLVNVLRGLLKQLDELEGGQKRGREIPQDSSATISQ